MGSENAMLDNGIGADAENEERCKEYTRDQLAGIADAQAIIIRDQVDNEELFIHAIEDAATGQAISKLLRFCTENGWCRGDQREVIFGLVDEILRAQDENLARLYREDAITQYFADLES